MITKAKKEIIKSGIKQVHIAELIGVNTTLLSAYVNGRREMPKNVARAIANVLRVKLSAIV